MDFHIKSQLIVKLLFLRKLGKVSSKINLIGRLFGKIPLLINKYEICPNFCQNKFTSFSTVKQNSNTLTSFNFRTGQIANTDINEIAKTKNDNSYIEQIKDSLLFISGGSGKYSYRFTILQQENNKVKTLELKTVQKRNRHRTIFDDKFLVYLIGGETTRSHEAFNMKTLKFTPCIQDFSVTLRTFGLCLVEEDFYVFGGFNYDISNASKTIYTCSPISYQ